MATFNLPSVSEEASSNSSSLAESSSVDTSKASSLTSEKSISDILNGIVGTEIDFDTSLKEAVKDLIPAFLKSGLMSEADAYKVFGNMEDLSEFHHNRFGPELFRRLRKRERPMTPIDQLHAVRFGQLFIDYSSSFDSYFSYVQNRPKSETFVRMHTEELQVVLSQAGKTIDELKYLLKLPLKRLDQYQEALEELFRIITDDKALKLIQEAIGVVSRQFRYGEALYALHKIPRNGISIDDQLLFRIDDLTVKKEYHLTGREKFRCVFLFTKCIIITKRVVKHKDVRPVRKGGEFGQLKFKGHIDFRQPEKCGISGLRKNEPVFKVFYQADGYLADVYAFTTESMETRNQWVKDICEVLGLRTHLLLKTGDFGSSSFLKSPSLLALRGNYKHSYADHTDTDHKDNLNRHSWPRHMVEEVREAIGVNEGRVSRHSVDGQIITSELSKHEENKRLSLTEVSQNRNY